MSFLKVDEIRRRDSNETVLSFSSNNDVIFTKNIDLKNPVKNRNMIINGEMLYWPYSTNATGQSASYYSSVGRFYSFFNNGGTFTLSQSTDVPANKGFKYSWKWDCTTASSLSGASDYQGFNQKIEGQNLQHLCYGSSNAKPITLSFWVKSNKTGIYTVEIAEPTNSTQISKIYTIREPNRWEKKKITYPGNKGYSIVNSYDQGFRVQWWLGANSTLNGGVLNASGWKPNVQANRVHGNNVNLADSTNNEFYITGVQLEVGDVATEYEHLDLGKVQKQCLRYYYKTPTNQFIQSFGGNNNNKNFTQPFFWPVRPMRKAPTITHLSYDGHSNRAAWTWAAHIAEQNFEHTYVTSQYVYMRKANGTGAHMTMMNTLTADAEIY